MNEGKLIKTKLEIEAKEYEQKYGYKGVLDAIYEEGQNNYEGASKHIAPCIVRAYIAGAEPREKKIADLEKENAELKAQMQKKINTTTVSDYPYSALKLEEAKELLDKVLRVVHSELHPYQMQPYMEVLKQAEQFLSEVEK